MLSTWWQNKEKIDLKSRTKGSINGSDFLIHQSLLYLSAFRLSLESKLDQRLVRTFVDLFIIILTFRNSKTGLLLSELGGFIKGQAHAPAGTKRISNLLRSKNWEAKELSDVLLEKSKARYNQIKQQGKLPLLIWDESRIEKPESIELEGLCSVESSKGKRLTRIKRGFYQPPVHRICVPGFHWTAAMLTAAGEVPAVCQMEWWTTRGENKEDANQVFNKLFDRICAHIEQPFVHVMDRGYAKAEMVSKIKQTGHELIIRWVRNRYLIHEQKGEKKIQDLSRSFRSMDFHKVYDLRRKKYRQISIAFTPVRLPQCPDYQLYLVIVRDTQKHQAPMYILTSIPIKNTDTAWEILYAYIQRWNIEQAFRCNKSELGIEAPRLWFWENRLKLLTIVTLVFDFLLSIIRNWNLWLPLFFRKNAHRTGNRYRQATVPIYRLRMAIANYFHQPIWMMEKNSG